MMIAMGTLARVGLPLALLATTLTWHEAAARNGGTVQGGCAGGGLTTAPTAVKTFPSCPGYCCLDQCPDSDCFSPQSTGLSCLASTGCQSPATASPCPAKADATLVDPAGNAGTALAGGMAACAAKSAGFIGSATISNQVVVPPSFYRTDPGQTGGNLVGNAAGVAYLRMTPADVANINRAGVLAARQCAVDSTCKFASWGYEAGAWFIKLYNNFIRTDPTGQQYWKPALPGSCTAADTVYFTDATGAVIPHTTVEGAFATSPPSVPSTWTPKSGYYATETSGVVGKPVFTSGLSQYISCVVPAGGITSGFPAFGTVPM